jgi:hypothetical protein
MPFSRSSIGLSVRNGSRRAPCATARFTPQPLPLERPTSARSRATLRFVVWGGRWRCPAARRRDRYARTVDSVQVKSFGDPVTKHQLLPGFTESIKELHVRGFDVVDFLSVTKDVDGLCAIEMDCVMARRAANTSFAPGG